MVRKILIFGMLFITTISTFSQEREEIVDRPWRFNGGLASGVNGVRIDSVTTNGDTLLTYVDGQAIPFKSLVNPGANSVLYSDTSGFAYHTDSSSFALNADSSSFASRSDTATYALNAIDTAVYADTSGIALNVSQAYNGLTKIGVDIGLGGGLNKNTAISGNTYDFELGVGGSALDEVTTRARYIAEAATQGWLWEWDESDALTFDGNGLRIDGEPYATQEYSENYTETYFETNKPALPYNYEYVFSSNTANSRPGVTFFQLNTSDVNSATKLLIDDFDANSVDKSNFLQLADTGSIVYIENKPFDGNYVSYRITGGVIDSTGYTTYEISYLFDNGGNFLSNNDDVSLVLELTGSGGGGGAGFADKLVSPTDTLFLDNDTLRGPGIVQKIFGYVGRWFVGDYILVDSIGFKSGEWVTGVFNTAKWQVDTTETNVIIIQGDTIDQGMIPLAEAVEAESFNELNLELATKSDHVEARLWYDADNKTFNFQNDINGFTHNLGENNFRVYNNTGVTIPNGKAVRRTGTYTNGSRVPTIDLAGIGSYDSSRVGGITTVDIPPNSYGVVTLLGDVNGLPTDNLSENDFYLWHNGDFLDTIPPPPFWAVRLGWCSYSDAVDGAVSVNISAPTYSPTPIFTANFSREDVSIPNNGIGVFELITNATNDLYTERLNYGFNFVGDSINPLQDGIYHLDYSFAYHGDAVQSDEWRIGVFVNGVEQFTVVRTSSSDQWGVVGGSFSGRLDSDDWVTFKIDNETSGTRTSSFTDGTIALTYFKLF